MAGPASIILAGVAAVGALTSAGMSFSAAARQKKAAKAARIKSEKLLLEAKKNLEKMKYNFDGLNVPLDAYEKAATEDTLTQQMAIQALQEGDPRNLAAGIGGVNQVAVDSAENRRIALSKELFDNRKMKIEKKTEVEDELISMGLGQSKQYAQESQDMKEAANASQIAGVSSIGQAAATMSDASKTFGAGKQSKAITDISADISTTTPFANFSKGDISSFLRNNVSREDLFAYQQDASLFDFSVLNGELSFKKK